MFAGAERSDHLNLGRAETIDKFGDLVSGGHARAGLFAQQSMTPGRRRRGHRSGNNAERSAKFDGVVCRIERAGAPTCFDHHCRLCHGSNQPIALQKTPLCRREARRHFSDHRAACDDALQQGVVPARVEAVNAAGQHGNRVPFLSEGGAVRHAVNAVGGAGDNRKLLAHQTRNKFHRHVFAIASGCARADNRNRPGGSLQGGPVSSKPQRVRCVVAELTQASRPRVVSRNHELRTHASRCLELRDDVSRLESCRPSREPFGEFVMGRGVPAIGECADGSVESCRFDVINELERIRRAVDIDEGSRHAVAGLDDARPHHSRYDVSTRICAEVSHCGAFHSTLKR